MSQTTYPLNTVINGIVVQFMPCKRIHEKIKEITDGHSQGDDDTELS